MGFVAKNENTVEHWRARKCTPSVVVIVAGVADCC